MSIDNASSRLGSLGEHKIRDLNDDINKLLREKKAWEKQIKALGGPDYYVCLQCISHAFIFHLHQSIGAKITDSDGKRAVGADGYYYFGAAKELPGVQELFAKQGLFHQI